MKKSFAQIPFNPAHWPFFYGWAILFWGIIGVILSVPGQTTGVSAFIEPLIHDLNIGRLELTIAYGIGTFSSSFLITPAGKLFDRIGARWMGFGSCLILGLVLLALSQTGRMARLIEPVLPGRGGLMALLSLLFFALRLSGQGILTMSSRNMIMKWFDHHRGLASGISGAAVAFGFSYSPTIFSSIINERGWSGTWFLLGMLLILLFSPLLLIFFRDAPEPFGLSPDGRIRNAKTRRETLRRQFTLPEARRTLPFWAFTLTMSLQALIITANTFHVESIFSHAGMDGSKGFAIFPPIAYISIVITLLGGWLSDRIELRWLLLTMLTAMAVNLLGFSLLAPGWPVACLVLGGGVANGLFGILMSVTWPRYFGREHLGAISGLCMTFMVIFSALGPAIYSGVLKFTLSYAPANWACLAVTLGILAIAAHTKNPQKKG
ncbi:MFS transporter [Pontiella agarivorans]|uniref:MFS transporter n=1 Tax=Pontiella agarivorans TaxID=3038953 RepID=A0ABU5MVZ0_9BACT|nr:MFS transporter [Pontiella agarivorans]MDZ8118364.1 MFS transporter [Pontiella agarivorans]